MNFPQFVRDFAEGSVARGAARLDQRRPNWWRDINPRRLNMAEGCNCIIGQLYGDYDNQYIRRIINNLTSHRHHALDNSAATHGFLRPLCGGQVDNWLNTGHWSRTTSYYKLLDRLWIQQIEDRREADLANRTEAASVAPQRAAVAA